MDLGGSKSSPAAPVVKVQSLTATARLTGGEKTLDLERVIEKVPRAYLRPENVPRTNAGKKTHSKKHVVIKVKISGGAVTVFLYESGRIACMGAKKKEDATSVFKNVQQLLRNRSFDVENTPLDFQVRNVIGAATCKFAIKLEEMSFACAEKTQYEPEIFPGLWYREKKGSPMAFVVFASGKVIIEGAKDESEMERHFNKFYQELYKFKMTNKNTE